jgi:hypothetical protein
LLGKDTSRPKSTNAESKENENPKREQIANRMGRMRY